MSGPVCFLEGCPFQSPDDILVDRYYAEQQNLHAGASARLLHHDWRVAGIVEPGKLARLFVPLRRLQELTNSEGKINQAFLKLDDPRQTRSVIDHCCGN